MRSNQYGQNLTILYRRQLFRLDPDKPGQPDAGHRDIFSYNSESVINIK